MDELRICVEFTTALESTWLQPSQLIIVGLLLSMRAKILLLDLSLAQWVIVNPSISLRRLLKVCAGI